MLYFVLLGIIALLGLFLIIVVLLQSGQGGGLAGIASGGATQQVLGTRQAPDLLERITWTMGALFIVLCILTNFALDSGDAGDSVIQQRAGDQQTQQPMMPGQQQQQDGVEQPPQEPLQQEPAPTPPPQQDN